MIRTAGITHSVQSLSSLFLVCPKTQLRGALQAASRIFDRFSRVAVHFLDASAERLAWSCPWPASRLGGAAT